MLFEDAGTVCSTLDAADAIAQAGSPAWVYHLTFPPTYLTSVPQRGSAHVPHAGSVLRVRDLRAASGGDGIAIDADDTALSVAMQNAWGSFVRTGVPSTTPAWPVYAPTTPGDLASVSVMLFDSPNSTVPGNLFRRVAAPRSSRSPTSSTPTATSPHPTKTTARSPPTRVRPTPSSTPSATPATTAERRQPARRRRLPHHEPLGHAHRRTARRRPRRLRQQVRREVPRHHRQLRRQRRPPSVPHRNTKNRTRDQLRHRRQSPVRDLRPRRDGPLHRKRRPDPVAALEHQAARPEVSDLPARMQRGTAGSCRLGTQTPTPRGVGGRPITRRRALDWALIIVQRTRGRCCSRAGGRRAAASRAVSCASASRRPPRRGFYPDR